MVIPFVISDNTDPSGDIGSDQGLQLSDLDFFSNVLRYPPENAAGPIVIRGPDDLFPTVRVVIDTSIEALAKESPLNRPWIVEPG